MDRDVHPLVRRAANGVLPDWARAGASRRAHMNRVAELLESWAERCRLSPPERIRWRALGFLHDALRDAKESELGDFLKVEGVGSGESGSRPGRSESVWSVDWEAFRLSGVPDNGPEDALDDPLDDGSEGPPEGVPGGVPEGVPGGVLHGPAAALRLLDEGVSSESILSAVAYHTTGHPDLGASGRALYCADFLEPGRAGADETRAELRERYADDPEGVLRAVVRKRMRCLLDDDRPIFLGTVRMWNRANR